MMKIVVLFALVAAAVTDPIPRFNALSPTGRIVGGEMTRIEEVPYQVSVQLFSSHMCGGSIISDTWILTAAHCMIYEPFWYNIRAGTTRAHHDGSYIHLNFVINHADYHETEFNVPVNDIALLKLRDPLTFDSTQAIIPLYNAGEEAVVGASSVITGWGALVEGGYASNVLQTVSVPIVSKSDCDSAYSSWGGLPDGQICAAVPEGGKDACQGDSGGPLAIDGRLAGVTSWGNGCARAGFPGVYTEVASYRAWITENSGV